MTNYITTNSKYGNRSVYHSDETCQYLRQDHKPVSEAQIAYLGLEECQYCSGKIESSGQADKDCPYCKEEVKSYAKHLPCEESP